MKLLTKKEFEKKTGLGVEQIETLIKTGYLKLSDEKIIWEKEYKALIKKVGYYIKLRRGNETKISKLERAKRKGFLISESLDSEMSNLIFDAISIK